MYEIQPTIAKVNEIDSKSSDVNLQALTVGDSVLYINVLYNMHYITHYEVG
jgi:hypothetical protein